MIERGDSAMLGAAILASAHASGGELADGDNCYDRAVAAWARPIRGAGAGALGF